MIATNEIKGLIRARGMTQADVAKRMGIHEATLNRKLNKGVLNSNEIEAISDSRCQLGRRGQGTHRRLSFAGF